MNKKILKATFAFLFIAFILWGCSSKEELIENGNEGNLDNYSNTTVEVQTGNSSLIDKDAELSTTKGSNTEVALGTESSEKIEPESKGSDPNKAMVIFQDEEGNVLKFEEIVKGEDAIPPDPPEKDGYQFVGWNYDYEDVQTDLTVVPVFEEITEPSIVVKNVTVEAGDKIGVAVSVVNNPGFLGMVTNIQYDEGALELTDVSNGSIMGDYTFTPPKNMKSGCNAAWNINDMPEGELNGEIMVLHFKLLNKVTSGDYSVTVSCLNNAFDNSYNAFSFDSISGSVKIR